MKAIILAAGVGKRLDGSGRLDRPYLRVGLGASLAILDDHVNQLVVAARQGDPGQLGIVGDVVWEQGEQVQPLAVAECAHHAMGLHDVESTYPVSTSGVPATPLVAIVARWGAPAL